MGKIVMDALTYGSFHQEVVLRLSFLKHHVASKSFYDKALYYANNINLSPDDRILDVLTNTQAEIIADFGKPLPGTTPTIYYSNLIWEFVYILLFYSHFEEPLWKETILPRMWKMQKNAVIRDEMKKGEEFVDEYISARRDFNEKKRAASLEAETVPDIVQILRDINAGKIRYVEIDWEQQIKAVLKLCKLMPTKFPYVIWLWGLLSSIEDPTKRMDILGKMQDVAYRCIDSVYDARQFREDCACIYNIYSRVREYNINGAKVIHVWTDERKSLNDLAHILSDEVVDPKWLVVLANDIYCMVQDNKREELLTCVLRAFHSTEMISMFSIVDFAKNLYIAEGYRQYILSGKTNYMELPTLENFNRRIRNACFDAYIDFRIDQIKELSSLDNTRVDEIDDFEAIQTVYDEEKAIVERENDLEDFKGSPAYIAMWYPGRKLILDMINVFIQYLPKKIEKMRKAEEVRQEPKPESKSQASLFAELLQCSKEDAPNILSRLHALLDGKGGMKVALVLAAAMHKYHYLLVYPTEKQYKSEFTLTGTWRGVTLYIQSHTSSTGEFKENLDHIEI